MVRAGAPKRKEKEDGGVSAEDKAEEAESKRLRDFAFSRRLLSRSRSHVHHPSLPSKAILNSDGRDIVKKGHRKSKYLFAFPGLLSPVAGGKLGELTNLDSRNPILYVEFPQGRLKMFGTIVYPKNKYLTLHFPRGAGNIVCEDCFESFIVFSHAWWIGTKEQNPEEVRLPMPNSLEQDKHAEADFTAGAGQTKEFNKNRNQLEKPEATPQTASTAKPEVSEAESIGKDIDAQVISQSVRQSARTAGKTLKYVDCSSDSEDSDADESQQVLSTRGKKLLQASKELSVKPDTNTGAKASNIVDNDGNTPKKSTTGTAKAGEKGTSDLKRVAVVTAKTPLKAINDKPSVLKQSRIEFFCHPDPARQEDTTTVVNTDTTLNIKEEVITSAMKASINSTKRPRKVLQEDTEESHMNDGDDDPHGDKGTPSKRRKQVKSEQGAGAVKESTPTGKNISSLKGRGKGVPNRKAKEQKISKEKKAATANSPTPKGRKAASRSAKSAKSLNENINMEEEDSDSKDANDDSDDDYIG